MPFTTSGQETERALFLQPRSPHGASPSGVTEPVRPGSDRTNQTIQWGDRASQTIQGSDRAIHSSQTIQ